MEHKNRRLRSGQTVPLAGTHPQEEFYFSCKRLIDIVVSLVALIVLMPLMLLIAALIALESPGPVIFAQKRVGARRRRGNGQTAWETRPFTFYKFRSMYHDCDPTVHRRFMEALIEDDREKVLWIQNGAALPPAGSARPKTLKLTKDPRITHVGKIIRKTSLDELPQLWNVLKGEMTLVGPRPPIPYEVERYNDRQKRRLEAIPGLTCLWQVNGRSRLGFNDQVRLDIEYIENQSTWLDLKILLQTIPTTLTGRGAE